MVYAWHIHSVSILHACIPGPAQAHPSGRRAHLLLGALGSGKADYRTLSPKPKPTPKPQPKPTLNPHQVRQTIDAETIEMIEFVPWEDVPLRYPALFGDALGARTLKEAMGNRDPACVAAKTWTTFFAEE